MTVKTTYSAKKYFYRLANDILNGHMPKEDDTTTPAYDDSTIYIPIDRHPNFQVHLRR